MVLAFRRRGLVIPICLYLLVGRSMKRRTSGLRNESSGTERTGLFRRITAASLLPLIIISKVFSTFLLDVYLFWHINVGIEEIMADYVHQGMTRNWIFIYLGSFFFIVIKDVFLALLDLVTSAESLRAYCQASNPSFFFVSFLNKWNNPMDRPLREEGSRLSLFP